MLLMRTVGRFVRSVYSKDEAGAVLHCWKVNARKRSAGRSGRGRSLVQVAAASTVCPGTCCPLADLASSKCSPFRLPGGKGATDPSIAARQKLWPCGRSNDCDDVFVNNLIFVTGASPLP